VHEYVSIDEMEAILNDENISPLQACEEIINIAKTNGSSDDKSIVVIDK
jgi:serine/threonine protein phosphatase PrpC